MSVVKIVFINKRPSQKYLFMEWRELSRSFINVIIA